MSEGTSSARLLKKQIPFEGTYMREQRQHVRYQVEFNSLRHSEAILLGLGSYTTSGWVAARSSVILR